ncbi:unnamed protein product [Ceutorhynchus assimilis]|uniref:Uncharacterized protein n=1 Tax=Ceutorhynchus assimilis TaxID=467358 RepID=A0A9N9MH17_9CUCU|nr:unnamed protein product [Ceutorhynchus assimilis]
MAVNTDVTQFTNELNKLTKDKLIFIIIHQKIPDGSVVSEDLWEYVESHLNTDEKNFFDSDDHIKCDKVTCINSSADLRIAKVEIAAAKMLVEEERLVENLNYIIKLLKLSPQSEVTKHCKQTEPKQLPSTSNAVLDTASGGYAPVGPRAAVPRPHPVRKFGETTMMVPQPAALGSTHSTRETCTKRDYNVMRADKANCSSASALIKPNATANVNFSQLSLTLWDRNFLRLVHRFK